MNEVRMTVGWARIWVQLDSGAIDAVGSEDIAKSFEMKETLMSKKGSGYIAANGSNIKNYGENKFVGYTKSDKAVSISPHDEHGRRRRGPGWREELRA